MDILPADLWQALATTESPETLIDQIDTHLSAHKKKPLQLRMEVLQADVQPSGGSKVIVRAVDNLLSSRYPKLSHHMLWAYFNRESPVELAQFPIGSKFSVSGIIVRCDVKPTPSGLRLNIDLQNCQLINDTPGTPPSDPATVNAIIKRLENSEWSWGSGGTLKLLKGGEATHTAWNRPGSWKLNEDETMSLQRPGNDPPMTVIFTDSDLTNGGVTSHTGGKTTMTRTK